MRQDIVSDVHVTTNYRLNMINFVVVLNFRLTFLCESRLTGRA